MIGRHVFAVALAFVVCAPAIASEVRGYTRADGTVVAPHHRITRDHHGKIKRSHSAKKEFQRASPCPATGNTSGPCGGYVVDHKVPLCAGGADHPSNMQWQTVREAKIKDQQERQQCSRK